MSNWDIKTGDCVFFYHIGTGMFFGAPQFVWSPVWGQKEWMIPMTSTQESLLPVTLESLGNSVIDTSTVFHLSTMLQGKKFLFHSHLNDSSAIIESPPQRVLLTDTEEASSIHTQWMFRAASVEQSSRNDTVLHYGMPVYLLKVNFRRYLTLDLDKQWAAVYHTPLTSQEMDPWILIPASEIHTCIDKKTQRCHNLSGNHTIQAMMKCSYQSQSSRGQDEVECFDDEGHPIYRQGAECREVCQLPSYTCSGPPLYQCDAHLTPGKEWHSYDSCLEQCLPSEKQSIMPLPVTTGITMWILLFLLVLGGIVLGLYVKKKRNVGDY
jgi:hypothetical protein